MSRYLRYTLLTLLWVAVAAYIVFAASAVRRVCRTGTVGKLEIEVVDSSSQGHLVSAAMVPPVDFTCRNQDTRHGS